MIMKNLTSLNVIIRLRVLGTNIETLISQCSYNGIELKKIRSIDNYTAELSVNGEQFEEFQVISSRCNCEYLIISTKGFILEIIHLKKRFAVIGAIVAVFICAMISSLYIWRIDVVGNDKLSKNEILRCAEKCGVRLGAYWPELDADKIRCEMMLELKELGWVGIVVKGSSATIQVLEMIEAPEIYNESISADVVAKKAGIVYKTDVQNGKQLVNKGQTVIAGQVLISGTMDSLSNPERHVCSKGSILAKTWYENTAVFINDVSCKTKKNGCTRMAIVIGKNRINFYKNTGKMLDGYDKITRCKMVGIDGLFLLPVTFVIEKITYYDEKQIFRDDVDRVSIDLREEIDKSTDNGVISCSFSNTVVDGTTFVTARAECIENIGEMSYNSAGE